MSLSNFPSDQFFAIISGNGSFDIATMLMGESLELSQLRLHMVKVGAHNVGDSFKLQIYSSNDALLVESESVETIDFENVGASHWYGYATFSFARYPLQNGRTYKIKIEASGITYDASRYYGVKLDWPFNINDYVSDSRGAAMSIAGYK